MLRRTGFKKPERPAKVPALLRPLDKPVNYARISANDPVVTVEKKNPLRSEEYRRLVAQFPCIHCGVMGYSQAAHPPPTGKGIKESDLECFPLCCVRPGIPGCHWLFDNYKLIQTGLMREQAARWAADTRERILATGKWPKNLPLWSEP
jgi:hypothetical protein